MIYGGIFFFQVSKLKNQNKFKSVRKAFVEKLIANLDARYVLEALSKRIVHVNHVVCNMEFTMKMTLLQIDTHAQIDAPPPSSSFLHKKIAEIDDFRSKMHVFEV